MISSCPNCKPHPFQDGKYGFKMRVFNVNAEGKSGKKARCTVCGNEKTSEAAKPKKDNSEAKDGKKAKAKAKK